MRLFGVNSIAARGGFVMKRVALLAHCAALLSFVSTLAAQGGGGGTLRGRVADTTGAPLARVSVSVDAIGLRTTTNDQGNYELQGVPAGTHTVRARVLGYLPQSVQVTVSTGRETRQDFGMRLQPISLAPIDVTVGSRARHTAAEELAVPVDVFGADDIKRQGTTETSQILQQLTPAVNFPHQSVTDAGDIVRPFTLRGLSPDQTLVLVNGWRQHQTALVNNFTYGMGAGSSGVDLNTIPQSAIERIEVLRDGASAQYGSDAIAGVVNLVMKEGPFTPYVDVDAGRYIPRFYSSDGQTVNANGGWGTALGRGSLSLFGEYFNREPTNRAYADAFEDAGTTLTDSIDSHGQVVLKRNPVAQPSSHWGDGLERDVMTLANFRMPLNESRTSEFYTFGGYSFRRGSGNGYRRCAVDCASFITGRAWPQIYPLGYLPEFHPDVTDYSVAGGFRGATHGWSVDVGASFGHNDFKYNLRNTSNVSLGPCLNPAAPCAPGPDGILGTADDPKIANQTSFFAGQLAREEFIAQVNVTKALNLGLQAPANLALGAAFRRERYQITRGDSASWINGGHLSPDSAGPDGVFGGRATPDADDDVNTLAGSQVFPGFAPSNESDSHRTNVGAYADLETQLNPEFLADVAGRFEHYSDFGSRLTGKLALRYQPTKQLTLRGAASTGFRAPGISQEYFSKVVTNVIAGKAVQVGIFPVGTHAARVLGAQPLRDETSVNLSGGFAYSPTENVTLTADYFYIKINHRIMLSGTFQQDSTLRILADSGITGIGALQYFTNGLNTRTQGVDFTANLRQPSVGGGTLEWTAAVNWTNNKITQVDSLPAIFRGTGETGLIDTVTWIGITEERPDWRGTLTGQYAFRQFHALARASYYGKFSSAQPGFCSLCRERYSAKTLIDAEVGYRFNQVDLSVGVRNLFDVFPDKPTSQVVVDSFGDTSEQFNNNFGTYPWAAASPFGYNGRYIYTRASITLSQ
ncbi:MAG TPA: TonB-dependent receptor [Gemmatimonadales bacterium]|nr:TonB-dependent receptor [Gemmatimonadales bacterium]